MKPVRAERPEAPEVIALRKSIRGEPLTDAEQKLLHDRAAAAAAAGNVLAGGVRHEDVMAELEERRRREQSSPRQK
jgi:hypothetical protein